MALIAADRTNASSVSSIVSYRNCTPNGLYSTSSQKGVTSQSSRASSPKKREVVRERVLLPARSEPGFQRLLRRLLGVETEHLVCEDRRVHHSLEGRRSPSRPSGAALGRDQARS